MKFINQWHLSLRLLWREARSGELSLMVLALVLAVTAATAIALFSARLDLAMQQRANELLGADLRLESTTELEPHWQEQAQALGLANTLTIHFPSMILAGDEMAMASVKVVTHGYPQQGELSLFEREQSVLQTQGPPQGEVWVEPRLAALLNAKVGDNLDVGRVSLTLTGIIAKESDRSAGFYSFSPRLMMNAADLAPADLISTGSRVRWRLLLSGEPVALAKFQRLPLSDNQKFQTLDNNNEALSGRLNSAQRYLGLAALLAVVLSCVAVAISAKRYAERNYNVGALMRTFGLSRRQVFRIYTLQLLQLGLIATLCGLGLAIVTEQVLLWFLAQLLPANLPAAPWSAWVLGASSGLLSLLGFALPYVLPLARVSPLKVLRRELSPMPLAGWLFGLIAIAALAVLLWLFTGDLALTALTLGGTLVLLGLMYVALLQAISALQRRLAAQPLPLVWRFAWQHLSHNKRHSAGQILAFALTLMVMIVIFSLRTDLLADWQADLPQDAPNLFAINVQPYELADFKQALAAQGLEAEKYYPTMPGRLVKINGQEVSELPVADDPSINRDLILTAQAQLSSSNKLVAGQWHNDGLAQVSVEDKLAQRLQLQLGDTLVFTLAGAQVAVTVTSLRTVDWGSMTPNFFMIFSPDVLVDQPVTYMTSLYLPPADGRSLAELIRSYPSVTFFDTQAILAQIQSLLAQVTAAIEWILVFVLVAALLVMLAALTAGRDERLQEGALIRTIGGSSHLLRRAQLAEFSLLAIISALLALLGAELLRALLYHFLLKLSLSSLGWLWLIVPPVAVLLLSLPALWLLRSTVTVPPLRVLRGV